MRPGLAVLNITTLAVVARVRPCQTGTTLLSSQLCATGRSRPSDSATSAAVPKLPAVPMRLPQRPIGCHRPPRQRHLCMRGWEEGVEIRLALLAPTPWFHAAWTGTMPPGPRYMLSSKSTRSAEWPRRLRTGPFRATLCDRYDIGHHGHNARWPKPLDTRRDPSRACAFLTMARWRRRSHRIHEHMLGRQEKHESCIARRKWTSRDDSGAVVSRPWR